MGYDVAEGRPVSEHRLPCGAAIPWYVGAFILLCGQYDAREKPGYVACLIAAILGTIAVICGVATI
ncbi:hypothetical protein HanLR1_Chr12g0449761 [Helianthus annuus]|nr:hypothetical protein HanLR1_Chr12g0449761 [Helianthus annuus]